MADTQVKIVNRLSPEAYNALVKAVGLHTRVQASTSALEAGQMIGVELVLRHLREGFVTV